MAEGAEIASSTEWKPFEHQVAGHVYGEGKLGMLVSTEGIILKPVQAFPKGKREVQFYESIFKSPNPSEDVLALRRFLPHYYGVIELPKNKQAKEMDQFLCLENLTKNFRCPCILDIKVGKCSWDQYADEKKIAREISKCPLQHNIGFRILGIKVYNPHKECYEFFDRHFCRKTSSEQELHTLLMKYLSGTGDEERKKVIMSTMITKMKEIEQWFLKQKLLSFRSSSVLLVYEGENNKSKDNDRPSNNVEECLQTEVKMIDFCHVFQSNEYDLNYQQGISSFMSYFEKCLEK